MELSFFILSKNVRRSGLGKEYHEIGCGYAGCETLGKRGCGDVQQAVEDMNLEFRRGLN